MNPFEMIPANEDVQIANIVQLTMQQLRNRYPGERLRGVHPKDHGCVNAVFEVLECLPKELQVGLFKHCGKKYEAVIRFSNAATLVLPDSTSAPKRARPFMEAVAWRSK